MKPIRSTAPATSILSPAFKYTPAAKTDVRETFKRAQRAIEAAERELTRRLTLVKQQRKVAK